MKTKKKTSEQNEFNKREVSWPLAIILILAVWGQITDVEKTFYGYRIYREGVFTVATVNKIREKRGKIHLTIYDYEYCNGKYKGAIYFGRRREIGDTVHIRYLADKPERYYSMIGLNDFRWNHE